MGRWEEESSEEEQPAIRGRSLFRQAPASSEESEESEESVGRFAGRVGRPGGRQGVYARLIAAGNLDTHASRVDNGRGVHTHSRISRGRRQ